MKIKTLAALAIVPALFTAPQIISTRNIDSFTWVSSARAHTVNVRINRLSATRLPKGSIIKIYGTGFGSRNSRNLLRLLPSRGRSAYPLQIRQWRNDYVEGKLPGVSNGRYILQLQRFVSGHHHAANRQTLTIIPLASRLLRPGINFKASTLRKKPGRTTFAKIPRLTRNCPDPALYNIHIRPHGRSADGKHRFLVYAIIKNVGRATYISRRNQQNVVLKFGSRTLKTSPWISRSYGVNMAPGQAATGEIYLFNSWNPRPGEFAVSFSARLNYGPDIRRDGNPQNDDCRNSNNSKTLSVREVNRRLRIPGF